MTTTTPTHVNDRGLHDGTAEVVVLTPALLNDRIFPSTVLHVATYRVAPDADDTNALQRCLDAVPANGGTVKLPRLLQVSSGVTVSQARTTVLGDGEKSSMIALNGHNFTVFTVGAVQEVTFQGFCIRNFGNVPGGVPVYGIKASDGSAQIEVRFVEMDGLFHGIYDSASEFRALQVKLYNLDQYGTGWFVTGPGGGVSREVHEWDGGWIKNGYYGINVEAGTAVVIRNLEVCSASNNAVRIKARTGCFVSAVWLDNVWCDSVLGSAALYIDGSAGIIYDARVTNSWANTGAVTGIFATGDVRGLTIQNTEAIHNAAGNGMDISGAVTQLLITGCRTAGNGGAGISIGANVAQFVIMGNVCGPHAGFLGNSYGGIYVAGGASTDKFVIADNVLYGNGGDAPTGTHALIMGATGTNKLVARNVGVPVPSAPTDVASIVTVLRSNGLCA